MMGVGGGGGYKCGKRHNYVHSKCVFSAIISASEYRLSRVNN